MRSNLSLLFGGLAVFFFVVYFRQTSLDFTPDEEVLSSLAVTGAILIVLYGLYWLIRRLRPNKLLWRIIFGLVILIVALLLFSISEFRQMISGWVAGISADGERPIVFAVMCLILSGYCLTRSVRSISSS
jgi:hypothetical protein